MGINSRTAYKILTRKVAKIDAAAAWWMQEEAWRQKYFKHSACLRSAFTWANTPQGFEYWENIHVQLKGVK